MKKLILIFITISILFTFFACRNENNINNSITDNIKNSTIPEQVSTMTDTDKTEKFNNKITVKIGDNKFYAHLYNTETANAFADMLPLTLDMKELHGNEKYFNLNQSLPTDNSYTGTINNGDIMLYGSDCIVLFYDSFSTNYNYTKIGFIENPEELSDAVGNNNIIITFKK